MLLNITQWLVAATSPSRGTDDSNLFVATLISERYGKQTSREAHCWEVGKLNASLRCDFIRNTSDCHNTDGYVNYLEGAFCTFPTSLFPLAVFLYVLWLIYLFIILAVTAEKFFCPNLSAISHSLRLSHNVDGVTFLAFGNGAPDVFSAVAAFSDSRTAGLAIGALFGMTLYNIMHM
ncbi:mitochondrial sodium/calcium exchanger protein [Bombina bombina]|uniref:mitochondrial sodium/calcium exchanger protein n=1 Tax=Bombina bombina TaxID=8345 RepID=UPI00235AE48B|nr:mitochondrial sodium/calcium exchanger protein [Bombina bombina]